MSIDGRNLAALLEHSHTFLDFRLAGIANDDIIRTIPGATISSIAHIYVHAVMTEDEAISRALGHEPLRHDEPYAAVLPSGIAVTPEWDPTGFFDPTVHDYVAAVRQRGLAGLPALGGSDIERDVPFYRLLVRDGRWDVAKEEVPLHFFLSDNVVLHTFEHIGEIAALRGVAGGEGIPVGAPVWSRPR